MENQNRRNNQNHTHTRGRPPKKSYDPELLMQELIDTVSEVYQVTNEIKATALKLDLSPNKVKKLLITSGVLDYFIVGHTFITRHSILTFLWLQQQHLNIII